MPELLVGRRDGDHINLRVLGRSHQQADDYWDGNWVLTEIRINIRPWHATYQAQLRTDEFSQFRDELAAMYAGTSRQASFEPMEPWLRLTLELDTLGHVTIHGDSGPEGFSKTFGQVSLTFRLNDVMDQADLPTLIAELDELTYEYPVNGRPTD